MNDVLHGFQNVCDKNALQENLTFIALYIGLYESFADTVESHVESFFCNDAFLDKNGKIRYKPSEEYVEEIKNRSVDDKGNHNTLKSTMLWFVENGALTQDDYRLLLELKQLRNSFAHKMPQDLWSGLYEEHAKALGDLLSLYRKIERWWIVEIEIPIAGNDVPEGYDADGVTSGILLTFDMMINTLYNGKSEDYLQIIRDLQTKDRGI